MMMIDCVELPHSCVRNTKFKMKLVQLEGIANSTSKQWREAIYGAVAEVGLDEAVLRGLFKSTAWHQAKMTTVEQSREARGIRLQQRAAGFLQQSELERGLT